MQVVPASLTAPPLASCPATANRTSTLPPPTKHSLTHPGLPQARKLSVDGDLRPVVEYLLSLGLDESAVAGVILRHPAVLCYSVEERLRPFVDFLVGEMQLPQEQVGGGWRVREEALPAGWLRQAAGWLAG